MRLAGSRMFRWLSPWRRRLTAGMRSDEHEADSTPATRVQTVRSVIRSMSVHEVAAIHTHLIEFESSADNHYFNPARPRQHLQKYVDAAPDVINGNALNGRSILEFGSGTRNHRSIGALLMANGASTVVCYEPGAVQQRQSDLAFDQLLLDVIKSPEKFSLPGSDPDEVGERAIRLLRDGGPVSCTSADELAGLGLVFDTIISNHVLEHVDDLDRELRMLNGLSHGESVQLHRVDFRDHRVFSSPTPNRSPVEFYRDGVLTTCNGLRAHEVESAFQAVGWQPDRRVEQRISREELPTVCANRFRHYAVDDLSVLTADWVVRRD